MADLKTLLNENNKNIKDYIDAIKIIYDSENKKIDHTIDKPSAEAFYGK